MSSEINNTISIFHIYVICNINRIIIRLSQEIRSLSRALNKLAALEWYSLVVNRTISSSFLGNINRLMLIFLQVFYSHEPMCCKGYIKSCVEGLYHHLLP
jgi:hypothetical protein